MMAKFYIRGPKFLQNETMFRTQLALAKEYERKAIYESCSYEERMDYMNLWRKFLEMAAEYGGFLTVRDLVRWMDNPNSYI